MIVKVANKSIKHPIELYIEDSRWEEISAIENKVELNATLTKLAMAHIAKHGYEIGYCQKTKKRVTLTECMNCGIGLGWGSGRENYIKWDGCKKENVHYKFGPSEPLFRTIKDEKLASKIAPQTATEKIEDMQTFAVVEKRIPGYETFDKQEDEMIKNIKEK
jgi:hypothetical protein